MKDKIVEALQKLDTANDNQWTQEGLPKIEILKFLMGGEVITREQINEAAPGFTRANPVIGDGGKDGENNEVASQQSAEGEQGQGTAQEQGSEEQKAEGDGAGAAGDEAASQEQTASVVNDEHIADPTVSKLTVGVHVTFADALKAVLTDLEFVDVKTLDDDELAELAAKHSDILSADNTFLSEVNQFVTKRAMYLNDVVEEQSKRAPQQSQADVLAAFHASVHANAQNLPINKPRQQQVRGPAYFGKQ